jgi:hypothetical protein
MAVFTGNGSNTAPSITFSSDTNTGIYRPGTDQLSIATNGTERLRIDANGQIGAVSLGTASAPVYTFIGDTNTGIFSPGADQLSIASNGTERLRINAAGQTASAPLDTASAPAYTFIGDTNTGIFTPSIRNLAFSTGGNERLRIASGGRVLIGTTSFRTTVGLTGLEVNSFVDFHGTRPYLGAGAGNSTNWIQIYSFSYNDTNTTDAGNLSSVNILVSGSSGNNWASGTLLINRKQQTSSKFFNVQLCNTYGSFSLNDRVAYKYDPTGGTNSAGLLEIWVRPAATFMGVSVFPHSITPIANEFVPLDTGSDTQPAGSTLISSAIHIDTSNRVGLGTASPTFQLQLSTDSAAKPSTNTWTISSDERLKEDIELADLDLCYSAVKSIPLKRYKWKDAVYTKEQVADRHKLGWIAQDVQTVFPKAVNVHEFKYEEEEEAVVIKDCLGLNADQLYAAMYGTIQKLIAKTELLEAEVAALKAQ